MRRQYNDIAFNIQGNINIRGIWIFSSNSRLCDTFKNKLKTALNWNKH